MFGNYGGVRNEHKNIDLHRENQRTSGEKKYLQKWLKEDTITYKFSEVRRVNAKINTVCNMIEGIRKTQNKAKRGNEEGAKKEENYHIPIISNRSLSIYCIIKKANF